jgi:hypothetical protein
MYIYTHKHTHYRGLDIPSIEFAIRHSQELILVRNISLPYTGNVSAANKNQLTDPHAVESLKEACTVATRITTCQVGI